MPPRLLMLLGAGCPPFLRTGGFSVLGAGARRRGSPWEGIWGEEKRRESWPPRHRRKAPSMRGPRSTSRGERPCHPRRTGSRGRGPVSKGPSTPPSLPHYPSPLSGGSHPSGSLCSFWGHYPLGCPSCHTNGGMRMGSCPPAPLPNLSLGKKNKRDRPGDQTGRDTGGLTSELY